MWGIALRGSLGVYAMVVADIQSHTRSFSTREQPSLLMTRNQPVAELEDRLGIKLVFTDNSGSVSPGYLKVDSVGANGF